MALNQRQSERNYRLHVDGPPIPPVLPPPAPIAVTLPATAANLNMQNQQQAKLTSLDTKTTKINTDDVKFTTPQRVIVDSLPSDELQTPDNTCGSLVTTSTSQQSIVSRTVPVGKVYTLVTAAICSRPTTKPGNANPVYLGNFSVESPAGTKIYSCFAAASGGMFRDAITLNAKIPASTMVRITCTPVDNTSLTWDANLVGYLESA